MKVALVGAGGIGKTWARALVGDAALQVSVVVDTNERAAKERANELGCAYVTDWHEALMHNIDAAIIAVPHVNLAPISEDFLEAGKHVLCEKPGGISSQEVSENVNLAKKKGLVYMPGFNHRYHAGYLEAKKRFDAGEIGELMFIRARYGFGGRKEYEKEWRFKKAIAGGGELLDQGIHMIDMIRLYLGDVKDVKGFAENMFWGGEVEDNGFVLLRSAAHKVAQIHVSWTNWEWVHNFEIFGTKGYLTIDGLDSRYRGPERLTIGHADPRSGEFPKEEVINYDKETKDDSFRREAEDFALAIHSTLSRRRLDNVPRGEDAVAALEIIEKIYAQK